MYAPPDADVRSTFAAWRHCFVVANLLARLQIRYIMVGRMAKPEEVLVVENEQGEVVREFMKDTDAINMYKSMRETLVYLTHLDYVDTERILTEKLQRQVNGTEWSWKNLNTVSPSGRACDTFNCGMQ